MPVLTRVMRRRVAVGEFYGLAAGGEIIFT
jgi:hypothetical protein